MNAGKQFLSDLKLHSDYLKWKENEGRYETWEEACESIVDGHRKKYHDIPGLNEEIDFALGLMKEKSILASQRNLQYRPEQIERNNARIYNCSSMYAARNRIFQEVFYLSLSGCGVGLGLLIPFVNNLSRVEKRTKGTKTYIIPDSIEGWSDALGVLMSSYFVDKQPFPEYAGYEIKFDYSQIRPKGSYISGGFKAPGSDGLRLSLNKIETLMDNWIATEGNKIRPILVCDVLCHASDAVLSGGVRRSALNMIVDPHDEEMIGAKLGNWMQDNPQRGRTNNSVLMLRNRTSKEYFENIVKMNDGISDIGFAFANSWFDMFNPCFEILKLPILGKYELDKIPYNEVEEFIGTNEDKLGVAFCNLTEINAEACKTITQFYDACRAASVIGTLQAGYTSFPYLGTVTEEIVKQESLLGVSITGWMNNPFLLDADLLKYGAGVVKSYNRIVSKMIGINQAARTTCVKPSGNAIP
jgi:ribonucleoside-diphosphate reductase alpha chain